MMVVLTASCTTRGPVEELCEQVVTDSDRVIVVFAALSSAFVAGLSFATCYQ